MTSSVGGASGANPYAAYQTPKLTAKELLKECGGMWFKEDGIMSIISEIRPFDGCECIYFTVLDDYVIPEYITERIAKEGLPFEVRIGGPATACAAEA